MTARFLLLRRVCIWPCIAALALLDATSCSTRRYSPDQIAKFVSICSEAVIRDVRSSDEYTREQIVERLTETKVPAFLSRVKELLDDPHEGVRCLAALNESIPIDDKVRKILKGGLAYGDAQDFSALSIRFRAAVRLAQDGDRGATEFLVNAARNSREPNERVALADQVAQARDKRLLPCAIALIHDEDVRVSLCGAEAAARMGQADGRKKLRSLVTHADPHIAGLAAGSLGRVGDREAMPKIRKLLQATDALARVDAAGALVSLGDPGGVAAMRQAVCALNKDVDRDVACSVLAKVGDYEHISLIEGIRRKSASAQVQRIACVAVVEIWERTRARQGQKAEEN
jgi:HEAT repeat protein